MSGQSGADAAASRYRGAQGLDPEFIKQLEKQFGFDKPAHERFLLMMKNYLMFDFGKSYFRDVSVIQLIKEKLPVSISLGVWMMLITYLIADPARHPQGGARRREVRHLDLRRARRSATPYRASCSPCSCSSLFAGGSFFQWFPSRGLTSENWNQLSLLGKVADYFWHLTLPLIALALGAFTTTAFLTKNSFLDEIRKQYVMTARAKGLSERQVLYGHVFRNAMLLIIAGFPGAFISAFFSGALLIETIFSLDGLGLLSFEIDHQPRLSRRLRHALHLRADGPAGEPPVRLHLHAGRSPHRFRDAGGVTAVDARTDDTMRRFPPTSARRSHRATRSALRACTSRPSIGAAGTTSRPTAAATGACGSSWSCSCSACSPR